MRTTKKDLQEAVDHYRKNWSLQHAAISILVNEEQPDGIERVTDDLGCTIELRLYRSSCAAGGILLIVSEAEGRKQRRSTDVQYFEEFERWLNRHPGDLDMKIAVERLHLIRNRVLAAA